ncbi:TPA: FtsH protease activity modulator HflK [Patescibacteria group bacterium]|nr:protease ftsh subunit hflk [candidate division SR1 bacterium RAAC1_SR1_1]HCY21649.1 FtsH protease activity modulator HflK [Candidatus Gracilibacteria bacterium]
MKRFLKFLGFDLDFIEDRDGDKGVRLNKFTFLPFNWLLIVFVFIIGFNLIFGSWFVLDKTEKGSVEYFGKFSHEVGPGGLYFKMPIISKVRKVGTEVRYRWELGFRTVENSNPVEYVEVPEEAVMLTKGGHLASVYWIIQYTIQDTYNWLYQVKNPQAVLDNLSQGSMRLIVGKTPIDAILTTEKNEIQERNKKLLQEYCDFIGIKVTINEVKLQDCTLPDKAVQTAYDAVMDAIKQKEKMYNEAIGHVNSVIPKAEGTAQTIINEARSYFTQQVNAAEGEVSRFMGVYMEYKKDPITTKQKLWFEAMQEVMPSAKKTVVNDKSLLNLKNFQ